MNEQDLKALVCRKFLGGDADFPLDRDTKLLDEGICDSLGLVRLAAELEKRMPGLKVADQEVTHQNFGTIGSILQFLSAKG
jgi:acyl carrier protein